MLRIKEGESSSSVLSDRRIPLKEVRVDAKIRSFASDVTLTQIFENNESIPVEVVYCFPVEENAAIYQFIARIDNQREIVAELKEKKAAQQEYIQALSQGHGAYLLEQDQSSNDIFIMSLGSLQAGSRCQITLSYVSELDLLHSNKKPTIRFVIPTVIAPRYSPTHGGIASPGGTQVKYVQQVPYSVEFHCEIDKFDEKIRSISSPSHPIKVDTNEKEHFLVTFSQDNVSLDRDILIDIELSETRANTILAIEKGAAMISLIPNEEDFERSSKDINGGEFLFVVDCSGSMEDENKIGLARKAMLLFLKSLPINCRFNIIRFGSKYESLFNDQIAQEYNQTNLSQAQIYIQQMQADLGGTELLEPFKWLQIHRPSVFSSRQIFLLTDGEVSNVNQIIDLCQSMTESTRIFSFGLGHSPSRALVKGLANATNGYSVFIAPNTNVDIYVAEQLTRALQPSLANINVQWTTNQRILHQIPKHTSSIFAGDRLLCYALFDDTIPFDHQTKVDLFINQQHKPIASACVDHIPKISERGTIRRLAAKALLRELSLGDQSTNKDHLINLSLQYGILCPQTAFVGIEKRFNVNSETNSTMELREIPIVSSLSRHLSNINDLLNCNIIDILSRSDRLDTIEMNCATISCSAQSFSRQSKRISMPNIGEKMSSIVAPVTNFFSSLFTKKQMKYSNNEQNRVDQPIARKQIENSNDEQSLIDQLIELQEYDGLWNLTEDQVKQFTGKSFSEFHSSTIDNMDKNEQRSIVTTAIIVILFDIRCSSLKTLWQPLVNKATQRLKHLFNGDQSKLEQLFKDIRDQFS